MATKEERQAAVLLRAAEIKKKYPKMTTRWIKGHDDKNAKFAVLLCEMQYLGVVAMATGDAAALLEGGGT